MTNLIRLCIGPALALALALATAPPLTAAEETLNGKLMCALCTLQKEGVKDCQDILVVTAANGAKTEYWVEKNDVYKKAGETCNGEVTATITGTVSEKDGKKWIAASKIEKK